MNPEEVAKMIADAVAAAAKASDAKIAAVLEATEASAAEVERLRGANKRLLVDLKKAKVKVRSDATEEDDEDDEDEAPAPKTAADRRLAALEKQIADREAALKVKTTKTALAEAIAAAGVDAKFRPAVAALFGSRKIEVDGDDVLVDGTPVGDALTAWAKTDEGKHYVAAPQSGVPGASKGRPAAPSSNSPTGVTRADLAKDPLKRGAFIRIHGEQAYKALPA